MTDESVLIDRALDGDRSAFTELVHIHQDRLFASMVQMTGSPDEAEDAVQDAFIRAFLKLDTFQRNSQFFTWLYRIAFNAALSRRRRKRPNVSLEHFRESSGIEIADGGEKVDSDLLRGEQVDLVRRAIATLSEKHQTVLKLREMQERTYEEIAEILEISIGTVRSRLNRARAALKKAVEQLVAEENKSEQADASGEPNAVADPRDSR